MSIIDEKLDAVLSKKNDMLYYNENTQTFNINPNYIVGFLPVDEILNVKNFVLNIKDISSNKAI